MKGIFPGPPVGPDKAEATKLLRFYRLTRDALGLSNYKQKLYNYKSGSVLTGSRPKKWLDAVQAHHVKNGKVSSNHGLGDPFKFTATQAADAAKDIGHQHRKNKRNRFDVMHELEGLGGAAFHEVEKHPQDLMELGEVAGL